MQFEKKSVRLGDIRPSEQNPREDFGDIGALARSIEATGGEPLNPPVVVADGNVFSIVDGERRYRALSSIYGEDREVSALVADTMDEANELVAMLATDDKIQLTEAERAQLDVIRRELGTQFCRRCNYCQPCTAGIAISGIFVLEGYLNRYGLGDWAKQRYAAMGKKAGDCVGCGACEKRCPYQLPIRQMLARCKDEFGA